jgi:hypothetical protein
MSRMTARWRCAALLFCLAATGRPLSAPAAQVRVRHREGLVHGFLVLRSTDGKALADGDLMQTVHGERVTNHLVFHFRDGSVHDETAIFLQRKQFLLLSYRLVQRGPSFERPSEVSFEVSSQQVTVRHNDEQGRQKVISEHVEMPADVANGLVITLLKNIPASTGSLTVSMVAATPKPRLVKLQIARQGEDRFVIGASQRKAIHYVVKVEIGGVTGVLAPLLGKQPPDTQVWIVGGDAPTFVKSEGPLYFGGPVWRIELTSPEWPEFSTAR